MKRLMMLVLVALLSLGVASVSFAQAPAEQAAPSTTPHAKAKKHTKKHKKSGKKGKKSKTPAAAEGMQ